MESKTISPPWRVVDLDRVIGSVIMASFKNLKGLRNEDLDAMAGITQDIEFHSSIYAQCINDKKFQKLLERQNAKIISYSSVQTFEKLPVQPISIEGVVHIQKEVIRVFEPEIIVPNPCNLLKPLKIGEDDITEEKIVQNISDHVLCESVEHSMDEISQMPLFNICESTSWINQMFVKIAENMYENHRIPYVDKNRFIREIGQSWAMDFGRILVEIGSGREFNRFININKYAFPYQGRCILDWYYTMPLTGRKAECMKFIFLKDANMLKYKDRDVYTSVFEIGRLQCYGNHCLFCDPGVLVTDNLKRCHVFGVLSNLNNDFCDHSASTEIDEKMMEKIDGRKSLLHQFNKYMGIFVSSKSYRGLFVIIDTEHGRLVHCNGFSKFDCGDYQGFHDKVYEKKELEEVYFRFQACRFLESSRFIDIEEVYGFPFFWKAIYGTLGTRKLKCFQFADLSKIQEKLNLVDLVAWLEGDAVYWHLGVEDIEKWIPSSYSESEGDFGEKAHGDIPEICYFPNWDKLRNLKRLVLTRDPILGQRKVFRDFRFGDNTGVWMFKEEKDHWTIIFGLHPDYATRFYGAKVRKDNKYFSAACGVGISLFPTIADLCNSYEVYGVVQAISKHHT